MKGIVGGGGLTERGCPYSLEFDYLKDISNTAMFSVCCIVTWYVSSNLIRGDAPYIRSDDIHSVKSPPCSKYILLVVIKDSGA